VAEAQTRAAPPAKFHVPKAAHGPASPWVPNPAVGSKDSYLIVDATSGRELASDRADELRHPASLTKLMTIYLTFSALDSGQLSLGDSLPVSLEALNASPTKMGMFGGSVTVRDAVMGLVTRSANDAAIVLGEAHDESEGAPARHDVDGLSQRLGPAQPRAGDHRPRSRQARARADARLPALLSDLLCADL
jgi:D-alanyl-D-alanine carboxypeptidase